MDADRLALFARNVETRHGFEDAAARRGIEVVPLSADPAGLHAVMTGATAVRAPGGLVAGAVATGAGIFLVGPTTEWLLSLHPQLTGRKWQRLDAVQVRSALRGRPTLIKLPDAKLRGFPARRFRSGEQFDAALTAAGLDRIADPKFLATETWLDIDSEYRVFTLDRSVLTVSPYRVQDDPWTPLLRAHHASMHDEAGQWTSDFLGTLTAGEVPPAAVLDVARLVDGRFVLLEANQCWGAGLYGCDPGRALDAVLRANTDEAEAKSSRWWWRPDPAGYAEPPT